MDARIEIRSDSHDFVVAKGAGQYEDSWHRGLRNGGHRGPWFRIWLATMLSAWSGGLGGRRTLAIDGGRRPAAARRRRPGCHRTAAGSGAGCLLLFFN